ncbi:MAG: helix-turn-helix domain-containing protein [Coriobacteriales bacterium]|jgi:hypothetical protein|nr:helix-turn-helix domain-containing protein [Coriobacteriales bacterium]
MEHADPGRVPLLPEGCLLVVIDEDPTNLGKWRYSSTVNNLTLLVVKNRIKITAVCNHILKIFEHFTTWENQLREIIQGSGNIKEMITISVPNFENPIGVVDQKMQVITSVDIVDSQFAETSMKYSVNDRPTFPKDIPAELIMKNHIKYKAKRVPYFYVDKSIYSVNLFSDDDYIGSVSLAAKFRPLTHADMALFEFLAEFLREGLLKLTPVKVHEKTCLRSVFISLLKKAEVNGKAIKEAYRGLDDKHQFTILCLYNSTIHRDIPPEYICEQIELRIDGSLATCVDSEIVILLSLDARQSNLEDAIRGISSFLAEFDFLAGVSNIFTELEDVYFNYLQAKYALAIGSGTKAGQSYYLFQEFALLYLLNKMLEDLPPRFFVPPKLMLLSSSGNTSGAEYWKTLHVYLKNSMNVTLTANELGITRGSLYKRLEKIHKILGIDLYNAKYRLYVEICMSLIEWNIESKQG